MSKKPCSISLTPAGENEPCNVVINGKLEVNKSATFNKNVTVKKNLTVNNIIYESETLDQSGETASSEIPLTWVNTDGYGNLEDGTKDGFYKKVVKIDDTADWYAVDKLTGNDFIDEAFVENIQINEIAYNPITKEGPFIVGSFKNAGGVTGLDFLAKWDQITRSWTSVDPNGDGVTGPFLGTQNITSIAFNPITGVGPYITGRFEQVQGNTGIQHIAYYDGSFWRSVKGSGSDMTGGFGSTIEFSPLGTGPYVGGNLFGTDIDTVNLMYWTGASWTAVNGVDDKFNGIVNSIGFSPSGDGPYIGGIFTNVAGITGLNYLAKWNGSSWTAVNGSDDNVDSNVRTIMFNPITGVGPYIGGQFTEVDGNTDLDRIAYWNGSSWAAVNGSDDNFNSTVNDISFNPITGEGPYVAKFGAIPVPNLAYWNGTSWTSVKEGGDGINSTAFTVRFSPDARELVIGGAFTEVNGNTALRRLASFDSNYYLFYNNNTPQDYEILSQKGDCVSFIYNEDLGEWVKI
jgi:hypothetical protein